MSTSGYRVPIHRSLPQPMLLAGVPRRFAILNGTLLAAITLWLPVWWFIPFSLVAHAVARHFSKKDPYFFEVMIRHLRQKRFYSA